MLILQVGKPAKLSYLKNQAEIEDLMQESYIKSFTKLHQFRLESSFSTWLIRIGINKSLARLKEKGKLFHLSKTSVSQCLNSVLEFPDSTQINPQNRMVRNETKQLLVDAIDQLNMKYKTVYITEYVMKLIV